MIKAIIFDCFGVLRPDVLNMVYQQFGGDIEADREFITSTLYDSNTGRIAGSAPVFAHRLGVSTEEWMKAIATDGNDHQLLNYILELKRNYKTAVLSNVGKGGMLRFFSQVELNQHFDVVVESGEIGYAKPEANAYTITTEKLGLRADECVFTDDRQEYCDGAVAVGMQAILYQNFEQFKEDLKQALTANADH